MANDRNQGEDPGSQGARGTRVSVVIPTHHRPALLRRTLESLAGQTYPRALLEIIVVATAGDEAFRVCEDFERREGLAVRCVAIPCDPWNGTNPAAKRNYGVEQADGHWIAFIDDDCVADPDWIRHAAVHFHDPVAVALEGRKEIPPVAPPTLTYKGLLSFTRPRGYQTCNMFYRRDVFRRVAGFDTRFPFYLEDTDLAWTVLDLGFDIPFVPEARVRHPVVPAAPWRLLDDARRVVLMPLLCKKHRARYRRCRMRAVRRSHWTYLLLYVGAVVSGVAGAWLVCLAALGCAACLTAAHGTKLFWGCRVGLRELLVTVGLLPVVPVVRLVQLVRGNVRYGVFLWT